MKRAMYVSLVVSILFCIGISSVAPASVIGLTLNEKNFNDLGAQAIPGWNAITTLMMQDKLKGEVTSQPFYNSTENAYYYLYQIENIGNDSSWHMIEVLSLTPFDDADGSTEVGYLETTNLPSSFDSSGTEIPAGCSVNTDSGPTISFVFPGYAPPYGIVPGETSRVLYVKSSEPPDTITGNIIDGSIADGDVIGPVPEPVTIMLMICGILVLVRKNKTA